jgi:hypothetical protein
MLRHNWRSIDVSSNVHKDFINFNFIWKCGSTYCFTADKENTIGLLRSKIDTFVCGGKYWSRLETPSQSFPEISTNLLCFVNSKR